MRLVAAVAAASLAAASLAGCRGLAATAQDDLSSWQAVPLPPDPGLAAQAAEACRPLDEVFAAQVVLQDQRTASTAGFLLASPGWIGSCMFSGNGGGSSSGWQSGPLPALVGAIAVDEQSSGGVGTGNATMHGGRIAPQVVAVDVVLADGTRVRASVGNGHWLAWWTGGWLADTISATSAAGAVEVLTWGPDGWAAR
jgi:hypothetical protein